MRADIEDRLQGMVEAEFDKARKKIRRGNKDRPLELQATFGRTLILPSRGRGQMGANLCLIKPPSAPQFSQVVKQKMALVQAKINTGLDPSRTSLAKLKEASPDEAP